MRITRNSPLPPPLPKPTYTLELTWEEVQALRSLSLSPRQHAELASKVQHLFSTDGRHEYVQDFLTQTWFALNDYRDDWR